MVYLADSVCVSCSVQLEWIKSDFYTLSMCYKCVDKGAHVNWSIKIVEPVRDISGDCNRVYCGPDCSKCCIPIIRSRFKSHQELKNSSNLHFDKHTPKLFNKKRV